MYWASTVERTTACNITFPVQFKQCAKVNRAENRLLKLLFKSVREVGNYSGKLFGAGKGLYCFFSSLQNKNKKKKKKLKM